MTTKVGSLELKALLATSACVGISSGETAVIKDASDYIGKRIENGDEPLKILVGMCDFLKDRLIQTSAEGRCFIEVLDELRKETPELVKLYEDSMDAGRTDDIDEFMNKYINDENVERYKKEILREGEIEDVFGKED